MKNSASHIFSIVAISVFAGVLLVTVFGYKPLSIGVNSENYEASAVTALNQMSSPTLWVIKKDNSVVPNCRTESWMQNSLGKWTVKTISEPSLCPDTKGGHQEEDNSTLKTVSGGAKPSSLPPANVTVHDGTAQLGGGHQEENIDSQKGILTWVVSDPQKCPPANVTIHTDIKTSATQEIVVPVTGGGALTDGSDWYYPWACGTIIDAYVLDASVIARMQAVLVKNGLLQNTKYTIGKVDASTVAAIKVYQKRNNLPVTGKPDFATEKYIFAEVPQLNLPGSNSTDDSRGTIKPEEHPVLLN
jgi:hypothetical protein